MEKSLELNKTSAQPLREWLAKRLATIQAAFPGHPFSTETNMLYLREMELIHHDIGPEALDAAITEALRNCKFIPTIAELRERAGLKLESIENAEAMQAWMAATEWLRKYGWPVYPAASTRIVNGKKELVQEWPPNLPPKIMAALRYVGGLSAINSADDKQLPFLRKEFIAAYKSLDDIESHPLQLPEALKPLLDKAFGKSSDFSRKQLGCEDSGNAE